MFYKIKNTLDRELKKFIRSMDGQYHLSEVSPLLLRSIHEFVLRDGKRVRPILFIVGYTGFAKRAAAGLYTSALSLELLHDFMLIHDDIVDKSDTRRGKPSMHKLLGSYLARLRSKKVKFDGKDLAIVVGDVMYAMAINAFLAIQENMERKERALKKFIEAAMYTGTGEFVELLFGIKGLDRMQKDDIYRIYDLKTAYYSFASPLATGAILAGAADNEVRKIFQYGIYVGRAFQIKDDILGMFGVEEKIGKPLLTDLQEGKKTILIYYAYRNSGKKNRALIKKALSKKNAGRADLYTVRQAIRDSRALDFAKREVLHFTRKSRELLGSSAMKPRCKEFLASYTQEILRL